MCWPPVLGGYTPEMIVVRAGAQTGAIGPGVQVDHPFLGQGIEVGRRRVIVAVRAQMGAVVLARDPKDVGKRRRIGRRKRPAPRPRVTRQKAEGTWIAWWNLDGYGGKRTYAGRPACADSFHDRRALILAIAASGGQASHESPRVAWRQGQAYNGRRKTERPTRFVSLPEASP